MYPFCMPSVKKVSVIISDSIDREADGVLVGSQVDSYKGGQGGTWAGTADAVKTIADTTNGGYARSPGNAFHSTTLDAGTPDASVSVQIAELPTMTSTAVNATMDFRKATAGAGDCYRLAIRGDGNGGGFLRLCKRVGGTITTIPAPDIAVKVGDNVRVVIKNDSINVFVNNRQYHSVTDNSITTGNFYGFSSATSTTANAYGFRNVVISQA